MSIKDNKAFDVISNINIYKMASDIRKSPIMYGIRITIKRCNDFSFVDKVYFNIHNNNEKLVVTYQEHNKSKTGDICITMLGDHGKLKHIPFGHDSINDILEFLCK